MTFVGAQHLVFGLTVLIKSQKSNFFVLISLEIACRAKIATVHFSLVMIKGPMPRNGYFTNMTNQ